MNFITDWRARRDSAFGVVPMTPQEHAGHALAERLAAKARLDANRLRRFGNRAARRRGLKGAPGARRPITPAERAHRKVRRAIAAASRKANRP